MSSSRARRFGLGLLVLFSSITVSRVRAESFVGSQFVDFAARGYSNYNLEFYAELVVGGSVYADAYASFGGLYGSSYSFIGESGVQFRMWNIHKVGSQWIADTVEKWIFLNSTGSWDSTFFYNVVLPSNGWVDGHSYCEGYTMPVQGWIDGWGTPPNDPPVPAIAVAGHSPADSVPVGTTITVYYSASDPDSNLNGIRYNAWNSSTGFLDNGGGSYVPQSGGSGLVTKTFTLSTAGDWYFWTEARDLPGATASTPSSASGFKIVAYVNPTTYCTPAYNPSYWNDGGTVQYYNNCYNYSNNRRTDTFAQPGRASGNMYTNVNGAEVSAGAISDGLEPTDAWSTSPDGKTKIALVIWPDPYWPDFHWYRLDSNGYWTHKPGGTAATNLDNSGVVITNPETADRGGYTEFIGYFFTPSDCVEGQGHANIN
jgi:hypothetical protein